MVEYLYILLDGKPSGCEFDANQYELAIQCIGRQTPDLFDPFT